MYIVRIAISIIKVKNAIMETANLPSPYNKKKKIYLDDRISEMKLEKRKASYISLSYFSFYYETV